MKVSGGSNHELQDDDDMQKGEVGKRGRDSVVEGRYEYMSIKQLIKNERHTSKTQFIFIEQKRKNATMVLSEVDGRGVIFEREDSSITEL